MVFNFKQIAMALITIAISNVLSAQGNLQFNQVFEKSYNQSISSGSFVTLESFTIDVGKVLKIESASIQNTQTGFIRKLFIGNHCIWSNETFSQGGIAIDSIDHLWLPAGTYTINAFHNWGTAQTMRIGITGIIFNVTPE
jgi:hypothetical protein